MAGSEAEGPTSTDARHGASSVRDRTVKDIISGLKRRRGAKPMPSTVQRAAERRKRRRREAQGLPPEEATEESGRRQGPVAQQPNEQEAEEAEGENKDGDDGDDGDDEEGEEEEDVVAPQMKIDEDGNIVIDQASLVVSAGTATNAEMDRGAVTVENHAFSNHITSATYSKRESATKWESEETDRFYEALRKFGTDFSLMESSFPKRSRRQLKLKFKREEKEFPQRVDQALNGPPLPLPPVKKATPPPEPEEAGSTDKAGDEANNGDDSDSDEEEENAKENEGSSDSDDSD